MNSIARISLSAAAAAVFAIGCSPQSTPPTPPATNAPVKPAAGNVGAAAEGTPVAAVKGEPIAAPIAAAGSKPRSVDQMAGDSAASLIPDKALGNATAMEAPKDVEPGYIGVGFDKLSGYAFDLPEDLLLAQTNRLDEARQRTDGQIPEKVKALNQQKVAVKGFMLPLKVEGGLVTEFLIMRDQSMCCYGAVPKINEWISVKMTGKGIRPMMDQPVTLFGRLHVGEVRENGYLVGIYTLDGEKMAGPQDM